MSDAGTPGPGGHLAVGRIIRPHGLRGAVIVEALSDSPERFSAGETLLLERVRASLEELTVVHAGLAGGRLVVTFVEVDGIDAAERLRGCHLFIPAERAVPLAEGEYWIHDIIGMAVIDEEGAGLGVVADYISGPVQDLLVVRDTAGGEFQVPFVEEFVRSVDAGQARITVRLIRGMGPGS